VTNKLAVQNSLVKTARKGKNVDNSRLQYSRNTPSIEEYHFKRNSRFYTLEKGTDRNKPRKNSLNKNSIEKISEKNTTNFQ
jgi:hypothetical protein